MDIPTDIPRSAIFLPNYRKSIMPNQHFNNDVSPKQLAEALLSGGYNHHKGTLKHAHKDAHCCLGVALVLSDPVDPTALDSMYLYGWIDLLGLFKLRYTERTTNVIPNTFAPWLMNIQSSLGNLNDSQISDVWPDVIVPFLLALDVDDAEANW